MLLDKHRVIGTTPVDWLRFGQAHLPGLAFAGAIATGAMAIEVHVPGPVSVLMLALGLGFLARLVLPLPQGLEPGLRFAASRFLQVGVVLLGLKLSLAELADLGIPLLAVTSLVTILAFVGIQLLGRWLGIGRDLALLVATGFAICGASAIAAMRGVTNSRDAESGYALALVTLFGSLCVLVLPSLAALLGLDAETYGAWVGGSVHDVGQVVAAASTNGDSALHVAVVVKLTRVAWLAPLVALVALSMRAPGETRRPRTAMVPWFVIGFIVAMLVNSSGVLSASLVGSLESAQVILFACALASVGASIEVRRLAAVGLRPAAMGLIAWIVLTAVSFGGVMLVGGLG